MEALLLAVMLLKEPVWPWKPPANPDPMAILGEAEADTDAGQYEAALAKHVWLHYESLNANDAFTGVRLSFALEQWRKLADLYPPAMDVLLRVRNEAAAAARHPTEASSTFESFQDLGAINSHLGEDAQTVEAFKHLDADHPASAERVYDVARDVLVEAKEYTLCGKYIRSRRDWRFIRDFYEMQFDDEDDPLKSSPEMRNFAEQYLTAESGTLIALLVANGRVDEAEPIAREAKLLRDDKAFHAVIDSALAGTFPERWPPR
jgi:hypothetical protein